MRGNTIVSGQQLVLQMFRRILAASCCIFRVKRGQLKLSYRWHSNQSRKQPTVMNPTFSEWTERLKVYNTYIKTLGEYKLNTAKAEKELAQAQGELAVARAKATVARQLERDLNGLVRLENTVRRKVTAFRKRERRVLALLTGRRIATNRYSASVAAYKTFEIEALLEAPDTLFGVQVPLTARSPSNFIDVRNRGQIEPTPTEVENGLQYMDWLHQRRYITKTGSAAQRVVIAMIATINSVAEDEVEKMKEAMAQMRDKTYQAWQPVSILGVPVNSAAKKVESAGTVRQ